MILLLNCVKTGWLVTVLYFCSGLTHWSVLTMLRWEEQRRVLASLFCLQLSLRNSSLFLSHFKATAAVSPSHRQSLIKIHCCAPSTYFMSPVKMWNAPVCSHHPACSLRSTHRWHIWAAESSFKNQLATGHEPVRKHANTSLFIYLSFPAWLKYLVFFFFFCINVLQTASPCLWVRPCLGSLAPRTIPGYRNKAHDTPGCPFKSTSGN